MILNIKIPHKEKPIFEGMIRIKLQTLLDWNTIWFDLTLGQLLAFLHGYEIMQMKILQSHKFL